MKELRDSFGRRIDYLRIAVTDRCNLRCIYCMPPDGVPWIPHSEILTYEEIAAVVSAGVELGINKVRLTGGEPLVRADLPGLVEMLSRVPGIRDLCMTTNGTFLAKHAAALKRAGLKRVNVSLDTLKNERFPRITGLGRLEDVLRGIEAARDAGLYPIKLNVVVMRGVNDDEVSDFARLTMDQDLQVRFIELMPFRSDLEPVPSREVRERIQVLGGLEPCAAGGERGPAVSCRLAGARGTIGFISPVTDHSFCSRCNRMRLSSDGKLRPCLLDERELDVKGPLRDNATAREIKRLILDAVAAKPQHHHLRDSWAPNGHTMSQIGG